MADFRFGCCFEDRQCLLCRVGTFAGYLFFCCCCSFCCNSLPFGKLFRLDGCFMTSEKDEFFYHENLVHPAAIAHPQPERALIVEYRACIDELLQGLSTERLALAVEIASIPEDIRGYGHVKERHLKAARSKWQQLMLRWRAPDAVAASPAPAPVPAAAQV